ncbi:phosphatase PAP2 family protein [Novispirillum sp. DQ9]|uniref:phosphatase PAP2 family protein n=1 Tax=Novispirillum sp. DQ9 TaxID=3398612 RepID=UPI003C7DA8E4
MTDLVLRHGVWLKSRPLLAAVLYAAVFSVISMALIDRPLALWLKSDLDPHVFGFFKTITDIGLGGGWFALAILAWLGAMAAAGLALTTTGHELWRLRARSASYVLATMAVSGVLVQALKLSIGRLRPKYLFENGAYGFEPFSGANSYPSGHSQVIWSVMIALWFVYPRYRAAYVVVALLVSLSRVATTVHFLSDTVMGSVLAIVVAVLIKDWFERDGRPGVALR